MLLSLARPADAQIGVVGDPIAVCLKRATSGEAAPALIARPAGFDCASDQRRFGPGDYWVTVAAARHDRRAATARASVSPACGRSASTLYVALCRRQIRRLAG